MLELCDDIERGVNAMSEERDIVVFTDDQGAEFELEVLDYFFYNGEEYAVLSEVDDCDCENCGHDHSHEHGHDHAHDHCHDDEAEVYIMKVVQLEGEMEEFVPVDDALMDKLIEVVQSRFDEDDDLDEEDDEEDDEDESEK